MVAKSLQDLSTTRLKELLGERYLPTSGTKNELIARLLDNGEDSKHFPSEERAAAKDDSEVTQATWATAQSTEMELMKLKLELVEKEKEIAIQEAELARRELVIMRQMQATQAQPATVLWEVKP